MSSPLNNKGKEENAGSLKILHFEDNPDDALLTKRYLQKNLEGITAFEQISSFSELEAALPKKSWDVIITDHSLSSYTSLDVLNLLKKLSSPAPVIVFTGAVGDETAVRLLKEGAYDLVLKGQIHRLPIAVKGAIKNSKRNRQLEETREKLENLSSIPNENPNPIVRVSKDGAYLFGNAAAKNLLKSWEIKEGCPVEEVKWRALRDIFSTGKPMSLEEKVGNRIFHFTYVPFEEEGYMNIYSVDVTQLKETERFLQSIFDHLPNMLFVKEAKNLRFVEFNKFGEKILGQPREKLIGRNDFDFFPEEQARFFTDNDRKVLNNKKPIDIPEETILGPDGELKYLHTRKVPILNKEGEPAFLLGISEDITDYKKSEEAFKESQRQLQAAQRMESVGRLAGGVAHDFNNLISTILGYAQFLIEAAKTDQEKSDLNEIRVAAERAAELTRHLLAFSRNRLIETQPVNLNEIISEMSKMLSRVLGEDISLSFRLSDSIGTILADPGSIEQAILNLAINARDAMDNGGTLVIETSPMVFHVDKTHGEFVIPAGNYVSLSVSDSGEGIPKEIQPKIFEPFFTTKEQGKGTGLGLSTIYGLVKQLGGFIWVYSEIGTGTTFRLLFRREGKKTGRKAAPQKEGKTLTGSEIILLVEDDDALRRFSSRTLKQKGYQVVEAENGIRALEILNSRKYHIDLILSDVVMPQMNGGDLLEIVSAEHPGIPMLFMSGYPREIIDQRKILKEGAALIQKPFSPEVLLKRVRSFLDNSRGPEKKGREPR